MDIQTLITVATSAITLFDKLADQIQRFIKKEPSTSTSPDYKMIIEKDMDGALVSKVYGVVRQKKTYKELEDKLENVDLSHIKTLEKSMQNYYNIWSTTYPQLSLLSDPIQKAKVELSLRNEILSMKKDLESILSFIESCGFQLDDHYRGIRDTLKNYV